MDNHQVKISTTPADLRDKVFHFAITSRLFVLFLSWFSNIIIPDHNAGVFLLPQPPVTNRTSADQVIDSVFGGLARWDSQYFLHISLYGYTYENTLAFFPLFPFFTRTLSQSLQIIFRNMINPLSSVLISAITVNFYFFVYASLKLFDLSRIILRDDILAYKSALFFCINPASIFFTAPYSESCFAFFTFSGMLFCMENNKELLSSFALGLSCSIRSNGVLNFGYSAHKNLKTLFSNVQSLRVNFEFPWFTSVFSQLCKLVVHSLVFFTPFLLFQVYAFMTFCTSKVYIPEFLNEYGKSNNFVMPNSEPPWCNYTVPFSYSYVQNQYWGVGFLRYYSLKQIPNFILASPVIYLVLRFSYHFMLQNRSVLFCLGFCKSDHVQFEKKALSPEFFVFVVHALILTLFCILFVHIQVTTRMIASSSPVLYWFVALRYRFKVNVVGSTISSRLKIFSSLRHSLVESKRNMISVWRTLILTDKPGDRWSYLVRFYFLSYVIVGTILFSNFLPWT